MHRVEFPAWRALDGRSLDRCGSLQANSAWVNDAQDELGDSNVVDLIARARARDRRKAGDFDHALLDRAEEALPGLISQPRWIPGRNIAGNLGDSEEDRRRGMDAFEGNGGASLFQTGTGKSVGVSSAAMKRALALLGGDNAAAAGSSKKRSSEAVLGFRSPGGDGDGGLFQTATGKMVPISATALSKARSLLGGAGGNKENEEQQGSKPKAFSIPGIRDGSSRLPASVPPFKQPRRRFTSPMALASVKRFQLTNGDSTRLPLGEIDGNKPLAPVNRMALELSAISRQKEFRLPPRVKLRDYFRHPPHQDGKHLIHVPKEIRYMTSDSAKTYKLKLDRGSDEIRTMLLEAGAKPHLATTEWVENHYRWIVWKLASQQRSYPRKARGFLNVQNVLRELKYRYVKEIENGHRSVLKKICERDTSAARAMTLCVSAIRRKAEEKTESCLIEVTDGWYCLNAALDAPLAKQLKAGKLFVGQKLQISGASLTSAIGGLPPLEAFSVAYLALHINGTYRAHWADKLGARKTAPPPLAFRCVKPDGGLVFSTCVAVTRIYPVLYREKLKDGIFVIRNARTEHIAQMDYEQRRTSVAEDVMANFQNGDDLHEDHEGAKLLQLLESASDPELFMADMTSESHAALSAYQARKMCSRQADVEKRIQKAFEQANLVSRDVTLFLKVNVTGLESNVIDPESSSNGSITIWNPSDALMSELVEGAAYIVSGLKPAFRTQQGQLQLNANKSSRWQRTPAKGLTFEFTPRIATQISNLADLQTYSEFDAVALVIHVGDVYKSGGRLRQWIFVADGSVDPDDREPSLLAVDFSSLADSFSHFESAYYDSMVGFCNLTKQHSDQKNRMCVAQASNATHYASKLSSSSFQHLRKPGAMVMQWALFSPQVVELLRQRVHNILNDDG